MAEDFLDKLVEEPTPAILNFLIREYEVAADLSKHEQLKLVFAYAYGEQDPGAGDAYRMKQAENDVKEYEQNGTVPGYVRRAYKQLKKNIENRRPLGGTTGFISSLNRTDTAVDKPSEEKDP